MPHNLAKENINFGDVFLKWSVKEYQKYERSRRWYAVAAIIGLMLVVYAVVAANYLFAMVIVLFGAILLMGAMGEPLEIPFAITSAGIIIGDKFYRYSELAGFWVIYNPPDVKNLYFSFNQLFHHRLQVPLGDLDPRSVRDFLNQYLSEDLEQEDEPLSDRISRLFRLH